MNAENYFGDAQIVVRTVTFHADGSATYRGINEHLQIPEHFRKLIDRINGSPGEWNARLKDLDGGAEILAMQADERREFIFAVLDWLQAVRNYGFRIRRALTELLNQKPHFNENEVIKLLSWSIGQSAGDERDLSQMIKVVENYLKNNLLADSLRNKILELAETAENDYYGNTAEKRKQIFRLRELAGTAKAKIPLVAGEAWSDAATAEIESLEDEKKRLWLELLNECQKANGAQPSAKWLKTANAIVEKIGVEDLRKYLLKWFPLVDKPRTARIESWSQWSPDPNELLNDVNADILKGLAWLCGGRDDKEIARVLFNLAVSAFRKVPNVGARCARVGNACVWALGAMPGAEGVAQLALLKLKVKFNSAQKTIEKALNSAAERAGLSPEEIEEMSVPSYGLTEIGKRTEKFGDFTVELVVTGTNAAEIRWFNSDGKPQKSVPKFVKDNHAGELKELANAAKDIKKMLPAQRNRIENLYLDEKRRKLPIWRERYLHHPLVGTIARRLVWRFTRDSETETAIWFEGQFFNASGREINWFDDETEVELWHPLHSETGEVLAWREFLQEREIRQPFKQAHREIYLLTDAERNTRIYSNRFAAHIIKQHQFNALCEQRGWKNALWIMADMEVAPPARRIPKHNLLAEFFTEPVGENYETDVSSSGAYLYLATDQVRFYPLEFESHRSPYRRNAGQHFEPVPLDEIPPLVFSEIMRDVDLFVGVASVGNDPNWADGGADNRYRDYWQSYSFGDLSETAKTRREVLAKLVPRLKIGDRCELSDKFLFVRGKIRTYKIHLGSGNILMSPNDQYLCIVPSASGEFGGGKVFLPFEGDRTLAVILSKAFLLIEDEKITDQTIIRQIKL